MQFHPESVLTQDGYLMLANWLERCGADGAFTSSRRFCQAARTSVRAALPDRALGHAHSVDALGDSEGIVVAQRSGSRSSGTFW